MHIELTNLLFRPKGNTEDIINELEGYMLTYKNKIIKSNKEVLETSTQKIEEKLKTKIQDDIIEPKERDSLFWCIYIIINGYDEYIMVKRNYNVCELEWKQKLSQNISKEPFKLKNLNKNFTKKSIQEIISDLNTSINKTNLNVLYAMCAYNNLNIIILDENKKNRIEILSDDKDIYLINQNTFNRYNVCLNKLNDEQLIKIRSSTYLIENNEKPIKSCSAYKVNDLIGILKKFDLYNENEKNKKQDMYNMVLETIKPLKI